MEKPVNEVVEYLKNEYNVIVSIDNHADTQQIKFFNPFDLCEMIIIDVNESGYEIQTRPTEYGMFAEIVRNKTTVKKFQTLKNWLEKRLKY